ncbi:unnamed protein product [Oppiella nova]|uniref:Uncharacterized protein n=1 Tax=Oppiella nova TaxID=334625 RepID=A0A7R9M992_9ACAR|nr:unnamed protein product [Oppiella nova]CAG2172866.1 unnamed protein product [Oppiella nova]
MVDDFQAMAYEKIYVDNNGNDVVSEIDKEMARLRIEQIKAELIQSSQEFESKKHQVNGFIKQDQELDLDSIFLTWGQPSNDYSQSHSSQLQPAVDQMPVHNNIAQTSYARNNESQDFAINEQYIPVPQNSAYIPHGNSILQQQQHSPHNINNDIQAHHYIGNDNMSVDVPIVPIPELREVQVPGKIKTHRKLGRPPENPNRRVLSPVIKRMRIEAEERRLLIRNDELKWKVQYLVNEMQALKARFVSQYGYIPNTDTISLNGANGMPDHKVK